MKDFKELKRMNNDFKKRIKKIDYRIRELQRMEHKKKLNIEDGFFKDVGKEYYNDPRYYKKLENGNYLLISMTKLLKECYPDKYQKFLEKERMRYRLYYKRYNKKVICECGCKITEKGLENHLKTKKHKKLMNKKI